MENWERLVSPDDIGATPSQAPPEPPRLGHTPPARGKSLGTDLAVGAAIGAVLGWIVGAVWGCWGAWDAGAREAVPTSEPHGANIFLVAIVLTSLIFGAALAMVGAVMGAGIGGLVHLRRPANHRASRYAIAM